MRNKIFFVALLVILFSCRQPKKDVTEDQVLQLINEVRQTRIEEAQINLSKHDFSPGVQEIMGYYDYIDPLIAEYTDIITIRSTAEFIKLKNHSPESVKALFIDNNDTDIKIDDISVFSDLEYLRMRSFDSLPDGFYKLRKLKAFLASHDLKGKIDGRILNLPDLEYLQLLFTYLELPPEIQDLKNLKVMKCYNFSYNQPYEYIFKIPGLRTLWMKFSTNEQLEGIDNLKNLKTLVTNKVSADIGNMKLTGLNISENNDESYPLELGNIETLVAFYWQGNNTKSSAPEFVSSLKNLEYLEIRGCSKFTDIPSDYDKLEKLKQFDILCRPVFSGEINHLTSIRNKINIK